MKIEIKEQEFNLLYNKAKESYKECISRKENEYLKDEIDSEIETIQIIENDIKFVFFRSSPNGYWLEVTLKLFGGEKEIGKYIYIEDETEEVVDDYLVFY